MVNENVEFRDEIDDDFAEKTLSIKEIILRQIRKIGDLSCKEFTGGYWEKKPMRTSGGIMFTEFYHDDVRQAYCNAVDFLVDILYPMSDNIMKDYLKMYEGYQSFSKKDAKNKDSNEYEWEKCDVKVDGEDGQTNKSNNLDELDIKDKLKLKRQTFRQINLMFERNNFWSGTGSYNE